MEILLVNDDGWLAPGMIVLARTMTRLGHVTVVVPDGPRSSMSNAISMGRPMTLDRVDISDCKEFTPQQKALLDVYTTNGTPADCVKLALFVLYDEDPTRIDLMVSGINHGSNASINVVYSGTMGACFVGCEHSIRAIGFSVYEMTPNPDFSYMEPYIVDICRQLLSAPWPDMVAYNVNAPVGPVGGVRFARQSKGHWEHEIQPRTDEQGNTTYWLVGTFTNDEPEAQDTDEYLLSKGFITIQPCTVDLTQYAALR